MQEKHKPEFFFWNECSTCQEEHLMSGWWSVDEMTDQQRESDKRLMRCSQCSQKSTWNKKEGNGGKKRKKQWGSLLNAFWGFCCDPVADAGCRMSLRNFRKSVSQEQMEWTGHTLSMWIYLCRAHELQPLLCNIWGTLNIYLAWHQPCIPFSTPTAPPNVQPTASSVRGEFPAPNAWQKLGCHILDITLMLRRKQTEPGQRLHQAQPTPEEHQKFKSQNEGEESQGFLPL